MTAAVTAAVTRPPGTLVSRTRVVLIPETGRLADLLGNCPAPLVFSTRERRLAGGRAGLSGYAGKLAAKLAAADLLGIDASAGLREHRDVGLAGLEVLPDRRRCPGGCTGPHPPRLVWAGELATEWQLSISHTRGRALALVARFDSSHEGALQS